MAENEKLNNVAVDNDVGTMEDVDAIMKSTTVSRTRASGRGLPARFCASLRHCSAFS